MGLEIPLRAPSLSLQGHIAHPFCPTSPHSTVTLSLDQACCQDDREGSRWALSATSGSIYFRLTCFIDHVPLGLCITSQAEVLKIF